MPFLVSGGGVQGAVPFQEAKRSRLTNRWISPVPARSLAALDGPMPYRSINVDPRSTTSCRNSLSSTPNRTAGRHSVLLGLPCLHNGIGRRVVRRLIGSTEPFRQTNPAQATWKSSYPGSIGGYSVVSSVCCGATGLGTLATPVSRSMSNRGRCVCPSLSSLPSSVSFWPGNSSPMTPMPSQ